MFEQSLDIDCGAADVRAAVLSHGWSDLAPFRVRDGALGVHLKEGSVWFTPEGGRATVRVESAKKIPRDELGELVRKTRTSLSLDLNLKPFWRICREDPELSWAATQRAGRILRAESVFADAALVLATTNCSWSVTRTIVRSLVARWGTNGAFPSQAVIADTREAELRRYGRLGYRARFLVELARQSNLEQLRSDNRSTDEVYGELVRLPGFGPYAAEYMLRLLGRFEHFALDSWVVPRYRALYPRRKPTRRALSARFARYGQWRGLAFWLLVTRDWYTRGRSL